MPARRTPTQEGFQVTMCHLEVDINACEAVECDFKDVKQIEISTHIISKMK